MGLITSMSLLGREQALDIFAPAPLKDIIEIQLNAGNTNLPFSLCFHALEEGLLIQADKFEVSCFKVIHRIDCWGFIFKEKARLKKQADLRY